MLFNESGLAEGHIIGILRDSIKIWKKEEVVTYIMSSHVLYDFPTWQADNKERLLFDLAVWFCPKKIYLFALKALNSTWLDISYSSVKIMEVASFSCDQCYGGGSCPLCWYDWLASSCPYFHPSNLYII